jgi:phenylalanine-4-hydroxylase
MSSPSAIPPHLRQYVVEQDYAAYTARDQAVWRFVVSQAHRRLCGSAHPAYAAGFRAAGISTERIPNLREMSVRLEREAGFQVVCVDGFIPPRAFQAFQARGLLPVAADIRSAAHLTYTPAPDIIHEAAGHAPFLAEPDYARFLRRIGAVSEQAFESAHDRAMYQVIHRLSELKESPESSPGQIAAAEAELSALRAMPVLASEATRLARLYWWTVEYGLVGSLSDYRLYGAGLLSSIGEAHFCHDPKVRKLPLGVECTEQDYDITQAQPQLFVADDFAALEHVLSEVEQSLSHSRGGELALQHARASGDVASFQLDSGLSLVGTLLAHDAALLQLRGPCLVAELPAAELEGRAIAPLLPLGCLQDGSALSRLSPRLLERHTQHGRLQLGTQAGLNITGLLERVHEHAGVVRALALRQLRITRGAELLFASDASVALVLAQHVTTASPMLPEGYYAATDHPTLSVPKPRSVPAAEQTLITLHEQLASLRAELPTRAQREQLEALHTLLGLAYPDEWLLRMNLLELTLRLRTPAAPLSAALERELEALEQVFQGREPIATGLDFLRAQRS